VKGRRVGGAQASRGSAVQRVGILPNQCPRYYAQWHAPVNVKYSHTGAERELLCVRTVVVRPVQLSARPNARTEILRQRRYRPTGAIANRCGVAGSKAKGACRAASPAENANEPAFIGKHPGPLCLPVVAGRTACVARARKVRAREAEGEEVCDGGGGSVAGTVGEVGAGAGVQVGRGSSSVRRSRRVVGWGCVRCQMRRVAAGSTRRPAPR